MATLSPPRLPIRPGNLRGTTRGNNHFAPTHMATSEDFALTRLPASFIPPIALDTTSETPLYRQISVWFQRAILAGQLQPGQRVPSTRALAKALRISRIPVLSAYELLIAEGYFQPFVGAGTCVSQSIPDAMCRAVTCDPSQILVTTGAQQGLMISALTLLDPRDEVWIEEPGYPGTQLALLAAGARMVPVPVDGEGLIVERGIGMAKRARAAFVAPSHQFPLRTTLSAARRMELLGWAARAGAWIVEDDYDSEFRFSGNPLASLQGIDTEGRVIYVGTLTKVMFPSLRLGYIVVPKDLVSDFLNIRNG